MSEFVSIENFCSDPIPVIEMSIHIEYESLRPIDLADLCNLINDAYNYASRSLVWHKFEYYKPGSVVFYKPELAIVQAKTGNSLDIILKILEATNIPEWGFALLITAAALNYGLDAANKAVDLIIKIREKLSTSKTATNLTNREITELKVILGKHDSIKYRDNKIIITTNVKKDG